MKGFAHGCTFSGLWGLLVACNESLFDRSSLRSLLVDYIVTHCAFAPFRGDEVAIEKIARKEFIKIMKSGFIHLVRVQC